MARRGRARALVPVVGAALLLAGCQGGGDGESTRATVPAPDETSSEPLEVPRVRQHPEQVMLLYFQRGRGAGGVLDRVENAGEADLVVGQSTYGGGAVRSVPALYGQGARFPAYADSGAEFAMLRVENAGVSDALSPGERDFSFGADVYMDDVTSGSATDDGDNLIQRGHFEGATQYKLQFDGGRPSCRVEGLAGEVIVEAERALEPEEWYRVRCTRRETYLRLEVSVLTEEGIDDWVTASRLGRTGPVVMPRSTALSVGGKLAEDGSVIPASTDQFNGVVDRVFLRYYD